MTGEREPRAGSDLNRHRVVGAFVLQAVVLALTGVTMYLRPLSVAACTDCDYAQLAAAVMSFFVVAVVAVGFSLLGAFVLRRSRWTTVPPLTAGAAVLVAFVITDALSRAAVGL